MLTFCLGFILIGTVVSFFSDFKEKHKGNHPSWGEYILFKSGYILFILYLLVNTVSL